jgi:hypothetical protein
MRNRRALIDDDPAVTRRRAIASSLVKRSAASTSRPVSGTDTVTIACKIASGVQLRLFEWVEAAEPLPGGGTRTIKLAMERETFTLKGCALLHPALPQGPGGYALTHGVPRAFWEEWLKNNHDSMLVKNGLVFAANSEARATDQAKEQSELKSGLEPIDPNNIAARVGRDRLKISTMPGAGALGRDLKEEPLNSALWIPPNQRR